LTADEQEEFFVFLESLANATFVNFDMIKDTPKTDDILNKVNIRPADYMDLIYNLTTDWSRPSSTENIELLIRNINNMDFIRVTQTLTENGICYTTNNLLAVNLSTSHLIRNKPPIENPYYSDKNVFDVKQGNQFDGDITYSFMGFGSAISIYLHSSYDTMNIARSFGYSEHAYEFETYSIEIITAKNFKEDTFVSQRGCRFHSESNLTHYKVYSKLLCLSECRLEIAMQKCGCIPFFYPNKSELWLN
jgi:acid-sensing ion channel, other